MVFIFIFLNSLLITHSSWINDNNSTRVREYDKNRAYYETLDEYGVVNIYNLTVDKTSVEIGENITVSTVYSLQCSPGYLREYGMIGIDKPAWFEYRNSLIDGVNFHNVTEIFSITPDRFNASDLCKGRIKIKIFNMSDPMDFIIYSNQTENDTEIKKAQLYYSLIEKSPSVIFLTDFLNLSFFIHNEHTENYAFSNGHVKINLSNGENTLNFSEYTDSKGILNFTVNCSALGVGVYTIRLENDATTDYDPTVFVYQLEVLDEVQSINCTLLNPESIYTKVDYDNSNFSKVFFVIQSEFIANISFSTDFESGYCSKNGNQYLATLNSPSMAGEYEVNFIAHPIPSGKSIEFNHTIEVKRRPTELEAFFLRYENQTTISCHINITDVLVAHPVETNESIDIVANYNNSDWNVVSLKPKSDGTALFKWEPPSRIQDAYISFQFQFNATPVYQFSALTRKITLIKFEYAGPFQESTGKEILIQAVLFALNGTPLPNYEIQVIVNDNFFNITTNANGAINFSFLTPSYATTLKVELQFLGSGNISASNLIFDLEIELTFLQQIWDSMSYILVGVGIAIISFIYVKKRLSKRNFAVFGEK